jgi:7-keto-8-aminopelargonate synthetase-like enzyme
MPELSSEIHSVLIIMIHRSERKIALYNDDRRKLVIADAVFSMDGDIPVRD